MKRTIHVVHYPDYGRCPEDDKPYKVRAVINSPVDIPVGKFVNFDQLTFWNECGYNIKIDNS